MNDWLESKLMPIGDSYYSYRPLCECCGHATRFFITKLETGRWRVEEERGGPLHETDTPAEAQEWIDADMKAGGPMKRLREMFERMEGKGADT